LAYQAARALLAKSDVKGSRQQFELAVSAGHRAAQVDLADLLVNVKAGMLDPGRAISLYERAWEEQVPIAAFRLGHFYEYGWQASDAAGAVAFHADAPKAWQWYQKGADAGEPNALARFGERDETSAVAEADVSRRNALLLSAFTRYAAAAEYAHKDDWPDDAWKNWRYRRATLARLLAREGMMQQVADAYSAVLEQRPPERTLWEKIKNELHL
jgi:TPR repeat protein